MKRFAIDVVLLPPDSVMNLALEWNQVLCKSRSTNIVLDKTHYLPHISIAMGCLAADRLEQASAILDNLATKHQAMELHVSQIKSVRTASGDLVVTLDLDVSPALADLHNAIVTAFTPLLTRDAAEEDLYDPPPIEPSAIEWINHYLPHQCFEHFWPHITLGFGELPGNFTPFSFQGSRLAICHLGNHCTCRDILSEVFLRK